MIKLHSATGKNRFCGPTAVSIITGLATDAVARMIRENTGRRMITGTHMYELTPVLNACGYDVKRIYFTASRAPKDRITLAAWLKKSKDIRTPGRVFIVEAGHHWQVVSGRRFACSMTKGKIVSVRDKAVGRRRRVANVWEVIDL